MDKEQTNYNKLVGRIGDDYYFCDYIFKQDDFKGATATVLCPVSATRRDEEIDPTGDYARGRFEDCWRQAVQAGQTTEGLDAYVEHILDIDGEEAVYDMSGYDCWDALREAVPELTEKDYPVFECVGGGRSFSPDMKWDEIYDEELWQKIKEIETSS